MEENNQGGDKAKYIRLKVPQLNMPVAIVIAGILIAGAIFYTGFAKNSGTYTQDLKGMFANKTVKIEPVSDADHLLGNKDGALTVIEYSDLECPFCKTFHPTLQKLMDTYGTDGKMAWVYRHFPLTVIHSKAPKEAEATECAAQLGGNDIFWKYSSKIFEITPSNNGLDLAKLPQIAKDFGLDVKAFNDCINTEKYKAKIDADLVKAQEAGGTGTPYSVFLTKKKIKDSVFEKITVYMNGKYPPAPNGPIVFANDTTLAISGALPYEDIEFVAKALMGIK